MAVTNICAAYLILISYSYMFYFVHFVAVGHCVLQMWKWRLLRTLSCLGSSVFSRNQSSCCTEMLCPFSITVFVAFCCCCFYELIFYNLTSVFFIKLIMKTVTSEKKFILHSWNVCALCTSTQVLSICHLSSN